MDLLLDLLGYNSLLWFSPKFQELLSHSQDGCRTGETAEELRKENVGHTGMRT